jgi:Glycosyltransferase family 87
MTVIDRARLAIDRLRTRIGPRRLRTIDLAARGGFVVAVLIIAVIRPAESADAHAYWAVDLANPYTRAVATTDAFTYPPPAAIGFWVLGHLPWPVFQALWTLLIGLALLWMAGPWSILVIALPVPIVTSDLYLGNIHILLAAAIVGAFRRPGLWAFGLLTKPSVGLAMLWYVVRREWRPLAIALGVTGAIALVSAILQPGLWPAWFDYILKTGVAPPVGDAAWVPIPLLIRFPAAILLVAWGARTNRPWTVPIAAMLALPVLWMVGLSMIVGAIALLRRPELANEASAIEPSRSAAGPRQNRTPAPRTPAFDAPDRSVEVAPDQPV